jgi:hypothetical protein
MKNTYYLIIAAVNLITSCQSKKKDVVDDINIIRNIYKNEKGVQRVPVLGNQLRGLFCDY